MSNFVSATYHPDILTVEYTDINGDHLLRSGGTIAWRFNNPGNLRPGSKYKLHIGKGKTKNGEFLIFPTAEAGRIEKKELLLRKYKNDSITKMMEQYAPPNENDTEKYLNYITSKSGLSKEAVVGKLQEKELHSLMASMEQYEGFNAQPDTRKEKWIKTTKITLSDGAHPIPHQKAIIKQGGNDTTCKTNDYGQLPAIPHLTPNEEVELWIVNAINTLEKIDSFILGKSSQNYTYFTDFLITQTTTQAHISLVAQDKIKAEPYSYVIQPSDTLGKIAKKFNTDVDKIIKDNDIRTPNKIWPGQRIWVSRSTPAPNSRPVAKIKNNNSMHKVITPARSKEGQGQPLAIISSDQKRAPWMEIAILEAKKQAGKEEDEIEKTINYHSKTGSTFLNSMTGSSNAWCASFVNWCLMESGFVKWKSPFRARAVASDPNFVQINKPIYGAIGLVGTHHACLIYGKDKTTGHMICLGGNQSDQINFTTFKEKIRLFVPITYLPFANNEIASGIELGLYDPHDINKAFNIRRHDKKGNKTR